MSREMFELYDLLKESKTPCMTTKTPSMGTETLSLTFAVDLL